MIEVIKKNSKYILWLILFLPTFGIMAEALTGYPWSSHTYEEIIETTGEASSFLLLFTLYISPVIFILKLSVIWSLVKNLKILQWVNGNKRSFGVFTFYYAMLHVAAYLLYKNPSKFFSDATTMVYFSGWIAFLILVPLFLTSTDRAVSMLQGRKWKALHRFVYIAAVALALHIALADGADGLVQFLPLLLLEIYRYSQYRKKRVHS